VATVPTVKRILETSLYVKDLERSAAFYAKVFGFSTLVRDNRMCAMAVPGQQVLLLFARGASATPNPSPAGLIPGHNSSGTQHLCFSITHDDLDAWTRHLIASDIEVEPVWIGVKELRASISVTPTTTLLKLALPGYGVMIQPKRWDESQLMEPTC
jgi:catechol 2,3-dioxygenase-like lactoylglutathione lyase family enzyme